MDSQEEADWGLCPGCKRKLTAADWEWWGGNTESGTDYTNYSVTCICGWDGEGCEWGGVETETDRAEVAWRAIEEWGS